jgi:hypothetical protein
MQSRNIDLIVSKYKKLYSSKRANIKIAKLGDGMQTIFHAIATRNYKCMFILRSEEGIEVTKQEQKVAIQ